MKNVGRLLLEVFAVILFGCSVLSTICFLMAETPQQAAQKINQGFSYCGALMPETWEAGVFNHGSYVKWYSLNKHPFLFIFSLAGIFISGVILCYLYKSGNGILTMLGLWLMHKRGQK